MNIKQGANKNFKFYVVQRGTTTPIKTVPEAIVFTAVKENCCGRSTLVKSLDNGISFDPETGKYLLAFVPADTINLTPGNYGFDIKIKRPGGQYFVVNQGYLKIEKSYTGVI